MPSTKLCENFEKWIREDLSMFAERGILSVL